MITELDLIRADSDQLSARYPEYITPELWEEHRLDWEYWLHVRECCGGTDWTCVHFRYYPDLDDRFTYREDY